MKRKLPKNHKYEQSGVNMGALTGSGHGGR